MIAFRIHNARCGFEMRRPSVAVLPLSSSVVVDAMSVDGWRWWRGCR
jgi:hypothetical protein